MESNFTPTHIEQKLIRCEAMTRQEYHDFCKFALPEGKAGDTAGLYGIGQRDVGELELFVNKMTGLQKAAFLYTGDLYHLRVHNDSFIFKFVTEMLKVRESEHIEDPIKALHQYDETYVVLAHSLNREEMMGKGKRYDTMFEDGLIYRLLGTIQNAHESVSRYGDFIACFFRTDNLPPSVVHFPKSIRRSVLTSDTDSTIFTTQDWVRWYSAVNRSSYV